ncbi:MAG TPA: class I fructose-bisphosphate aldolase [Candidatus Paceibacterota bacterium]|nr:class I fructose-bisphosphate aldolase [Candidatus Paceibacterota bacterium]
MDHSKLYETAATLLTKHKGILAADQSSGTMGRQLQGIGVEDSAENRRAYRQVLFTTPGVEEFVSGIILYDATIRNHTDDGTPFVDYLTAKGIVPIIKVDASTVEHDGFPGEVVTQGLDHLGDRLAEYYQMGARAAKWRAVFNIGPDYPTEQNILFDCIQLVRYAQLCHTHGIVPIVEPEVIFKGNHSLERAEEVTTMVLSKLFDLLTWYGVDLKAVILKSSFVLAGSDFEQQSTAEAVGAATVRTFENSVPHDVPGIVFLSGGQTPERATANLNAVAAIETERGGLPWEFAFSFSRGLEQPVQEVWKGEAANVPAAQAALLHRLRMNVAADAGEYEVSKES